MNFFFAIEQLLRQQASTGFVIDRGHGVRPHGTLSRFEAVYVTTTIRASDAGYIDQAGPTPYPPRVSEAFAVDALINLDPSASAVGAAWGAITLANNDGLYNTILSGGWLADGLRTHVLWGTKTPEVFGGFLTARNTSATWLDSNGFLQLALPAVVRQDYTSVLALNADGATNYMPISDTTGAISGSPGTLPSSWLAAGGAGLTRTLTTGIDGVTGLKYIDVRLAGTSSTTVFVISLPGLFSTIDATIGQSWTVSIYTALQAGSQTGITTQLGLREWSSGGTQLRASAVNYALPTGAVSGARETFSFVTNQATTRYMGAYLQLVYSVGQVIDITVRVMAPQIEGGAVATAYVPTTTIAAARAPTYLVGGTPPILNEAAANNFVLSAQVPAATDTTVTASTDVSSLYAGVPVWKHERNNVGASANSGAIVVTGLASTGITVRGSLWVWLPSYFRTATITVGIEGGGLSSNTAVAINPSLVDQWQRVSATAIVAVATTQASIVLRVSGQLAGDALYTSCWQLELDTGAPSTFIPPQAIPAVRAADNLYTARNIMIDPPYASLLPAFHGVAGALTSDEKSITLPLRDASYWLERPLLRSTYGGNGGYDGTDALAGQLKPIVVGGGPTWGAVHNFSPVLVDPVALIYQVSDGAVSNIQRLFEGGYFGGITPAGDVADLYSGATPAGQYRTCLARGCFQLGSQPTRAITADVCGLPIWGGKPGAPQDSTVLKMVIYVLQVLCGVPPDFIALDATGQMATVGATAAINFDSSFALGPNDNPTGIDMITRLLAPYGMKLVAMRDGTLRALVLAALPGSPTIKAALDDSNIISITPIALPAAVDPPPYRFRIGYNDNYTVQTTDISPLVTPTYAQYLATPGSVIQVNSPALSASIVRPNDPPVIRGCIVDGQFTSSKTVAGLVAAQYAGLFGVKRRLYGFEVPFSIGVMLDYGDAVSVTGAVGDLAGTHNGQVVGYSYRSEDASMTMRILM